ncbi:MAG TPA: 3-deoxy-7-phosphoheptulonate synthase [Nitrospirota bacterium]|nr:3-deoxy-7-phosphoheptulonate synthase [Nitrospirota bacterium]
MIIVLRPDATAKQIEHVEKKLIEHGVSVHISKGTERTIIGAIGDETVIADLPLEAMPGVEKVMPILKPYKLVSREFRKENTVVKVGKEKIGGKQLCIMAGPCAVEGRKKLLAVADDVKKAGANFIRGGAFKPRTSPYSFQGLGEEGLRYLAEVREKTGMPVVTELMDPRDTELVVKYADIIQIGARNMQNFRLLKEVGSTRTPVLLKRGLAATIKEFLMSAEYIMSQGNHNVIFCERGIRTFETYTRNTLDLSAVPILKKESHLPVIVDPSHGVGIRDFVKPMSMAAIAAGADGLMLEVHSHPEEALSDGEQSLKPSQFAQLMKELQAMAAVMGRTV